MWQINDAGDIGRLDDGCTSSLNDGMTSETELKARQSVMDSVAVDDAQILLSDLLASGIEAMFAWLTDL